jgi:hypothetical protein
MMAESRLITYLRRLIEEWQALATEARQRAEKRHQHDLLEPAYLYGCADQLERNAAAIRELIAEHGKQTG